MTKKTTPYLIGKKYRLRSGYDIIVVSQSNQGVIVTNRLSTDGNHTQDIRKYKLDHLQYIIVKELT